MHFHLPKPLHGWREFLGEVGILLVHWRLTGSAQTADRLETSIRENIPNPVNEALWAAPGTVVGALQMLEWTGDARWEKLFLENAAHLFGIWLPPQECLRMPVREPRSVEDDNTSDEGGGHPFEYRRSKTVAPDRRHAAKLEAATDQ